MKEKEKNITQLVWEKQSEGMREIYKRIFEAFSITKTP